VPFAKGSNAYQLYKRKVRPKHTLTVEGVPDAVMKLLAAASARRQMRPTELALQILIGVLYRGSLDRTVSCFTGDPRQLEAIARSADAELVS
jgi:hypothetical protein